MATLIKEGPLVITSTAGDRPTAIAEIWFTAEHLKKKAYEKPFKKVKPWTYKQVKVRESEINTAAAVALVEINARFDQAELISSPLAAAAQKSDTGSEKAVVVAGHTPSGCATGQSLDTAAEQIQRSVDEFEAQLRGSFERPRAKLAVLKSRDRFGSEAAVHKAHNGILCLAKVIEHLFRDKIGEWQPDCDNSSDCSVIAALVLDKRSKLGVVNQGLMEALDSGTADSRTKHLAKLQSPVWRRGRRHFEESESEIF